ncbi:HNH endonuclease [Seleniivibrio woodruffii]|uniref:HNH endonuclease n=1 Tax=Seleniivibrio woodruffii TaxID=1078050 RepID=UPI0039E57E31
MAYYWVNLGKTLSRDVKNGKIWSSVSDKSDKELKHPEYGRFRINDIIFPYKGNKIEYIGIVRKECYLDKLAYEYKEGNKPIGTPVYSVDVEFNAISPVEMGFPFFNNEPAVLFKKNNMLRENGYIKIQSVFSLGHEIVSYLLKKLNLDIDADIIEITKDKPTEMLHYIKIRTAQSEFKRELLRHWKNCCALTGINTQHLIASHIKPWKDSNDQERSDPYNGLPLLANYDYAFDKYLISFKNDGTMLFDTNNKGLLKELGVDTSKGLKTVYEGNKKYLTHHRDKFYETASTPSELQ